MTDKHFLDEYKVSHALLMQKVDEHTQEIKELRSENKKQDEQLTCINSKLDKIGENTEGVVEVVHFSRKMWDTVSGGNSTMLSGNVRYAGLIFNAFFSNSIYGASSTVQPIALDVIFIIKYSKG